MCAEALSDEPEEIPDARPPATAPANISVSLTGSFADEEAARQFGHHVAVLIRALSSYIDLERLDGVTIADDYDGALQRLDRGFQATQPLSRSNDERITGVAMAATVIRAGVVKSHLVFFRPSITAITDEADTDGRQDALYTIAHECGHVEDLKLRDTACPGVLLSQTFSRADLAVLQQAAAATWVEYAACRVSAPFASDRQVGHYVTGLRSTLEGARDRSNGAIRTYRLHGDVDRVLREATPHVIEPLRMFAYLLGTLDGHGRTLEESAPELAELIARGPYAAAFANASSSLRDLWKRRGTWVGIEAFDPLCHISRVCLEEAGMFFRVLPDGGVWVDVPFSPQTMPSGQGGE